MLGYMFDRSFAVSICTKLEDIISGLATPVDMKLKLIPIFQHMNHDPATTAKVSSLQMVMVEVSIKNPEVHVRHSKQTYVFIGVFFVVFFNFLFISLVI